MADDKKDDKGDLTKELSKDAKDTLVAVGKEIYTDLAKPSSVRLGNALGTVSSVLDAALSPVRKWVFRVDAQEAFFKHDLVDALERRGVPADRLQSPSMTVVGPALQSMQFTEDAPELRGMYAALLATAMDSDVAHNAHPAFAEIIRQLTPDEAKIIGLFGAATDFPMWRVTTFVPERASDGETYLGKHYRESVFADNLYFIGQDANCQHKDLVPSYADNLCRLGLAYLTTKKGPIRIDSIESFYHHVGGYEQFRLADLLVIHPEIKDLLLKSEKLFGDDPHGRFEFAARTMRVTAFGQQFYKACVDSNPMLNDPA